MNSFGRLFRLSVFGESHGKCVGVTLDGVPAGIELREDDFAADLLRRKSGAAGTTPRIEADEPEIISGIFEGKTTGAPLTIIFSNENTVSKDYSNLVKHPRPGHADFTGKVKFGGFNDYRGGGHFSARMTLALVAAGVVAKKIILPSVITAEIDEIGGEIEYQNVLNEAIIQNDSLGGIIKCTANGIPAGLGEPFFDSLESVISHVIFSIPAVKGIEFGDGFKTASMKGSEVNDCLIDENGKTQKNSAGGINGGISNSNDLTFRAVFRPTPSIAKSQNTFNFENNKIENLEIHGRHDSCVVLRAPVIVEAACACVLADFMLIEQKRKRIKE